MRACARASLHEALSQSRVVATDELESHKPAQTSVTSLVYSPHAALAEQADKFIAFPVLYRKLFRMGRARIRMQRTRILRCSQRIHGVLQRGTAAGSVCTKAASNAVDAAASSPVADPFLGDFPILSFCPKQTEIVVVDHGRWRLRR